MKAPGLESGRFCFDTPHRSADLTAASQRFEGIDCLSHRPSPPLAAAMKRDLLPGTLDMLILKTISAGPAHGYGIAQHIKQLSRDVLQVDEGSLYPALQRLRQRGYLRAEWALTPNKQRARYYTITAAGRKQLGQEEAGFEQLIEAIQRVMNPAS